MPYASLPMLLKIWVWISALSFILCCIPRLFRWPRIMIPAAIFASGPIALLVWKAFQ